MGKAGVVKSAHEFLLPMVVTGRGGKVMLAGELGSCWFLLVTG